MIVNNNNRLVIFFFYDKEGIVDEYIDVMLQDMKKNSKEILFVSNGKLELESKKRMKSIVDYMLERDNKGFDVWAYKEGMEHLGWSKLEEYDEVVLMNFTIMGPLYPFEEMFGTMNKKDIDFWGLTLYHGYDKDPFGICKYGYLPMHLQSHFIVLRKNLIQSKEFHKYWDEMPPITSYAEAVCYHEAIFTKHFEELGFNWDVYVDTRDILDATHYPLMMKPYELVKNRRCPFIKRRNFFHNYYDIMDNTTGEEESRVFEFIKDELDYDETLILKNLLRCENQAEIKRNLHFNYILPSRVKENPLLPISEKKIALVIHSYFIDLIEYCFNYAKSMPETSDIYITTDSVEKKNAIEKVFQKGNWNKVEVILIENRGRDVSALLVATKSFIMDYDYVCFAHDKKVAQLKPATKGESFAYKCWQNVLGTSEFVCNIINKFEENSQLGILMPPPPNHAEYYATMGYLDWGCNFEATKKLADRLKLTVKLDCNTEPIAPLGTMFWFRPAALRILFEQDWEYKDFPAEPNNTDGTLLHAIERIYPYVAQQEGYYPAWVMTDSFASIEVDNLFFSLRELNKVAFAIFGADSHHKLVSKMQAAYYANMLNPNLPETRVKNKIKRIIPSFIWKGMTKVYMHITK